MAVNTKSKILRMNPQIFLVWIFMISISMIFVSLISAYIVKKGQPGGFNVELPSMFYYSSVVVILSSIFKQLSYFYAKKDNFQSLKVYLGLSFLFGLLFLYFQFLGWSQLVEGGIFLVGHPDGSFIYILSGVHAFHLISGLIFIIAIYIFSSRFKIHSKRLDLIEISTTYLAFSCFFVALFIYYFVFL